MNSTIFSLDDLPKYECDVKTSLVNKSVHKTTTYKIPVELIDSFLELRPSLNKVTTDIWVNDYEEDLDNFYVSFYSVEKEIVKKGEEFFEFEIKEIL